MDLPLCKICGERHRLGFCPKYSDPAQERRNWLKGMTKPARVEPVATPQPAVKWEIEGPAKAWPKKEIADAPEAASQIPQADQRDQAQASRQAPEGAKPQPEVRRKFDKVAYQRDLMRKRRAAAKEQAKSA